jgi:hypothetical protein
MPPNEARRCAGERSSVERSCRFEDAISYDVRYHGLHEISRCCWRLVAVATITWQARLYYGIVLKSLAFYDQTFLSAGIPHGRDYNRPFALPRGLRGLLELFYCGVLCSGSLCERVAVQPAQTDVHLFTSRTIPRENQAQSQQSCAGA